MVSFSLPSYTYLHNHKMPHFSVTVLKTPKRCRQCSYMTPMSPQTSNCLWEALMSMILTNISLPPKDFRVQNTKSDHNAVESLGQGWSPHQNLPGSRQQGSWRITTGALIEISIGLCLPGWNVHYMKHFKAIRAIFMRTL